MDRGTTSPPITESQSGPSRATLHRLTVSPRPVRAFSPRYLCAFPRSERHDAPLSLQRFLSKRHEHEMPFSSYQSRKHTLPRSHTRARDSSASVFVPDAPALLFIHLGFIQTLILFFFKSQSRPVFADFPHMQYFLFLFTSSTVDHASVSAEADLNICSDRFSLRIQNCA